MRLTKKDSKVIHVPNGDVINETSYDVNGLERGKAIYKLGKLEDLEEELGITLVEAVELCKQVNSKKVVYAKDEWGDYTIEIPDESEVDIELLNHRLYRNSWDTYISLDFYDYGKTWALTKEELESGV